MSNLASLLLAPNNYPAHRGVSYDNKGNITEDWDLGDLEVPVRQL